MSSENLCQSCETGHRGSGFGHGQHTVSLRAVTTRVYRLRRMAAELLTPSNVHHGWEATTGYLRLVDRS